MNIPADMNRADMAEAIGARAVVSIRDMLILLGATDEQLRDHDEQLEILNREPWRRKTRYVEMGRRPDGMTYGYFKGEIDWTGTRFEGE